MLVRVPSLTTCPFLIVSELAPRMCLLEINPDILSPRSIHRVSIFAVNCTAECDACRPQSQRRLMECLRPRHAKAVFFVLHPPNTQRVSASTALLSVSRTALLTLTKNSKALDWPCAPLIVLVKCYAKFAVFQKQKLISSLSWTSTVTWKIRAENLRNLLRRSVTVHV